MTDRIAELVAALGEQAEPEGAARLARFGIVSGLPVLGVAVGAIRAVAKRVGRDQDLAEALWVRGGWYEMRLLAVFVAEPAAVTPALMDRWAADFDNWALCDTACFDLFDRTPHALAKVRAWAAREEEYVRRAAFALLAGVARHARAMSDAELAPLLPLIARHADDPRNFVKKAVNWALRELGNRPGLHHDCVALAGRLAASPDPSARWIGRDAARDLNRPLVRRRAGVSGPSAPGP